MTDNTLPSSSPTIRGSFLRFTNVLVSVFLLLYLFPLVLLRLPGFERWNIYQQSVYIDYIFATPHIDADIVILGESSAFYGIDPRQISSELDAKSLNLGNTLGTLPVTGRLELDRYLGQNKRPRLLVFYLLPWDLDFYQSTLDRYEGEEMLFRYGSAEDILAYSENHAAEMLTFPFKFYASNTPFNPARRQRPSARNRGIIQRSGHSPLDTYPALSPSCVFPDRILREDSKTASIDALLRIYQNSADKVILFLAPIPHCKGYEVFARKTYSRFGAVPPNVLPTEDFGDDTNFAHPLASSVPLVTRQLINALQTYLPTLAVDPSAR